jgi:hypothetical protein
MLILRECCGHFGTGNDKVERCRECVIAVEQAEFMSLAVPNSSEPAATQPNYPRFVVPVGSYVARTLLPHGSGVEDRAKRQICSVIDSRCTLTENLRSFYVFSPLPSYRTELCSHRYSRHYCRLLAGLQHTRPAGLSKLVLRTSDLPTADLLPPTSRVCAGISGNWICAGRIQPGRVSTPSRRRN